MDLYVFNYQINTLCSAELSFLADLQNQRFIDICISFSLTVLVNKQLLTLVVRIERKMACIFTNFLYYQLLLLDIIII